MIQQASDYYRVMNCKRFWIMPYMHESMQFSIINMKLCITRFSHVMHESMQFSIINIKLWITRFNDLLFSFLSSILTKEIEKPNNLKLLGEKKLEECYWTPYLIILLLCFHSFESGASHSWSLDHLLTERLPHLIAHSMPTLLHYTFALTNEI